MSSARSGGQDIREWRRVRAWALHQEGWRGEDIAAALKVSAGAVSGWLKRARAGGIEVLRRHPAPGPTPKLTDAQRAQLPGLLAKGAEAYGFVGTVWTTRCSIPSRSTAEMAALSTIGQDQAQSVTSMRMRLLMRPFDS